MKDLWSLVNFLGVKPFTEKVWWNRTIARPLAHRDGKAIQWVPLCRKFDLAKERNEKLLHFKTYFKRQYKSCEYVCPFEFSSSSSFCKPRKNSILLETGYQFY